MDHARWLILLVAAIGACTRLTPERQLIRNAAAALGGADPVQQVKTLLLEGEGINGNLGQDMTPEARGQAFRVTAYRRAVDLVQGRWRLEQTRTPNFTFFQGPAPQRQLQGLDGQVGYNIAPTGAVTRVPSAVASDRQAERYYHPLTILRAALDPSAKLANARSLGNEGIVDITTPDGFTLTLAADSTTNLPTRVVTMRYHINLGDVAVETRFADYQPVDGLQLPARLTTTVDNYTVADIRLTRQILNADVGDLAAPAAAASAPAIAGPPPATVTTEEIARGIWLLAGQSHHSVLVEFSDHLVLIEAPQHEARTLAVIAKARELKPDKPLTHVVNSHHHFDHSGGIRAAVAEGLTVITHKANAAFFEQAVRRSHSLAPDGLAKNPRPLKLETVDEELVLKDSMRTVHLYRIAGSPHAETLLMAYFPRERILVEADAFTPGAAVSPYAANLLENIERRKLRIERIVPLHGKPVPYAELVKTVRAGAGV